MTLKKIGLIGLLFLIMVASGFAENEPIQVGTLSGTTGLAMVQLMDRAGGNSRYAYTVYKSPDVLVGKLIAGETDIATLPMNSAAILYNKGVPIQLTAVIGWGVMYLVSGDPAIRHWKDLKGKEVYIPAKGAVPDLLFRYLSAKNGLDPAKDLTLQYVASPVELAQLVAVGKVTTAALPEPWVTEVLAHNPRLKIALNFQTEWKHSEGQSLTYPQSCLVARKALIQKNPAALRDFSKQLTQSIGWLGAHPQDSGVLAEKYVQISALSVQNGWKRFNLKYAEARTVRPEVERFLTRLGEVTPDAIGGKLPDDGFYYQP